MFRIFPRNRLRLIRPNDPKTVAETLRENPEAFAAVVLMIVLGVALAMMSPV